MSLSTSTPPTDLRDNQPPLAAHLPLPLDNQPHLPLPLDNQPHLPLPLANQPPLPLYVPCRRGRMHSAYALRSSAFNMAHLHLSGRQKAPVYTLLRGAYRSLLMFRPLWVAEPWTLWPMAPRCSEQTTRYSRGLKPTQPTCEPCGPNADKMPPPDKPNATGTPRARVGGTKPLQPCALSGMTL